ncbi:unnamed protein product [Ranitomeya imitator]|uniref:Uncharacterized protein n=1 Tax=Ranitomeya imitator TaxID=111125 RepID=A0ABN9MN70_9NEOB|nr:unnamed protein product [Ranitomeya imitator]
MQQPFQGYISVIKMHFGTNLPAGRFGGRTAHALAILQDGGTQGEDGRTDTGRPGEPLNGQLDVTDTSNPTGNRDSFIDTDVHIGQPTGSLPSRQPGRVPSYQPDNQVPPLQPPRRNRDFNWKQMGSTDCSVTCGKGSRYPIFRCVNRITHEEVSDVFCDLTTKPSSEEEPCNHFPCPALVCNKLEANEESTI